MRGNNMFKVESKICQQSANIKDTVSLRVMDFIHYKEFLMLLGTYIADFSLLILQGFYIKQQAKINSYFTRY